MPTLKFKTEAGWVPISEQLPDNLVSIDLENSVSGSPNLINADTLGGAKAEEFALRADLASKSISLSEIDNIVAPGCYYITLDEEATIGEWTSRRWWMDVSCLGNGANFATQVIRSFYGDKGYTMQRDKLNGVWNEWRRTDIFAIEDKIDALRQEILGGEW